MNVKQKEFLHFLKLSTCILIVNDLDLDYWIHNGVFRTHSNIDDWVFFAKIVNGF